MGWFPPDPPIVADDESVGWSNWKEDMFDVFDNYNDVAFVSANYTADLEDFCIACDSSGGSFTVTLPDPTDYRGKEYIIKQYSTAVNAITVAPSAGQIQGKASVSFNGQSSQFGASIHIISLGSVGWVIFDHHTGAFNSAAARSDT